MRKIFRKISAIAASALMVGMTMGVAAAANYPAPFVAGGAADVAIVYGTGAGVSSLDLVQAGNIQSNLQSFMAGGGSGSTTVSGDAWQVATSSDNLEIGEPLHNVQTFIGNDEIDLLSDGSVSNEKGDATYEQFLYFENDPTKNTSVIYTEDDDDNLGLFLKFNSGAVIARYVMDFNTDLKSDVESDGDLSDIEDKMITFLGKSYTITYANNGTGTAGTSLTLMSGALSATVNEGDPVTVDGYTVDVTVSSSSSAQFTITSASGTETTDKMAEGDIEKLSNGQYIAVTDITYEGYADGDQSATFYIGADKIEWKNGQSMVVNGETIGEAAVTITDTESGGDISISEIAINMTAEDDLFVPVGGKLSEAADLDEPEVLVSQNWDIQFAGLEAIDYEDLSLKVSGSDKKYTLRYQNYNGDEVVLPLLYTNATGVFGGDDKDSRLVLDIDGDQDGGNITKKDYFLLHTSDPKTAGNNAKTILVRYDGSDSTDETNPKVTFTINPGTAQYEEEMSLASTGAFTLKVAGGTFNFVNATTAVNDDFAIELSGSGDYSGGVNNDSVSNYIRTYYNTLINISDTNFTKISVEDADATGAATSANWKVNVTIDDTNRDGDDFTLPANGQVFTASIGNTTTDASLAYTGNGDWQSDPSNDDIDLYITRYGVEITNTDPSDSPASIEVKIPKTIVKPLVYITTKEGVVVSSTTGGATQLGDILVKDSEVSSVSSKNLIVVGGSCINSVAANLLGSACGSDFTDKTGVGSGQFLIESMASSYSTGKIALIVAGYEAADTVNGATYLRTQTVDTTVGKKYKGTSATSAELQVA